VLGPADGAVGVGLGDGDAVAVGSAVAVVGVLVADAVAVSDGDTLVDVAVGVLVGSGDSRSEQATAAAAARVMRAATQNRLRHSDIRSIMAVRVWGLALRAATVSPARRRSKLALAGGRTGLRTCSPVPDARLVIATRS